jgi:hypothetical protein
MSDINEPVLLHFGEMNEQFLLVLPEGFYICSTDEFGSRISKTSSVDVLIRRIKNHVRYGAKVIEEPVDENQLQVVYDYLSCGAVQKAILDSEETSMSEKEDQLMLIDNVQDKILELITRSYSPPFDPDVSFSFGKE